MSMSHARRGLVALSSLAVLVAALLGYITQRPHHIPMDPATPATVTTIGGPR